MSHPVLKTLRDAMHQLRGLMLRGNPAAPLQTLANTLEDWIEPIACMWGFVRNNGITEGFHRKMKLIQRRAYGFRNFEIYRLRVIAQCG